MKQSYSIGLALIMMGITLLIVSLVTTTATILWGVSLGVSIFANIAGTAIIMQSLAKEPRAN